MTELFTRITQEKRDRIMETAIIEFADFGYENANTNTIAKKAGISVGSLYKYFDNKEDLFLTTVKYCVTVLKDTLECIMEGKEDLLIKIEKILRAIIKHSRDNVNMIKLYNELTTNTRSALVIQAVKDIEGMSAKIYSTLIERLQSEGEVRNDVDPRMLAFLMDNLFMMLQFSYSCTYYQERFKTYLCDDILEQDEFVIKSTLNFIESAFYNKKV